MSGIGIVIVRMRESRFQDSTHRHAKKLNGIWWEIGFKKVIYLYVLFDQMQSTIIDN